MRLFPNCVETLLETPFLSEPEWSQFSEYLVEVTALIGEGESILNAEADRCKSLAVCFATILKGGGVFLANPQWGRL